MVGEINEDLFPEGKIQLLNGNELVCYQKAAKEESDECQVVQIKYSGERISLGRKSVPMTEDEKKSRDAEERLLLKNAFFFLEHADLIFSDSRMFLVPVPIHVGIAYTGEYGFHDLTLGVFLEWWKSGEGNITVDRKGRPALTYCVNGSPLSGRNYCRCVYPDGKTAERVHIPFLPVWSGLMNINKRYTAAKAKYEAYTLEQVLAIIKSVLRNTPGRYEVKEDEAWTKKEVEELLPRYLPLMYKYRDRLFADARLFHVQIPQFRSGGTFCGHMYIPVGELMNRWECSPQYRLKHRKTGVPPVYVFQFGFGLSGLLAANVINLDTGEILHLSRNDTTGITQQYDAPRVYMLRDAKRLDGYRVINVPSRKELTTPPASFSELLHLLDKWEERA